MTDNYILQELSSLKKTIEQNLKKRGLVPAKKTKNGIARIGNFYIKKEETGLYSVLDSNNNIIAQDINLPHSAAVLANNLALGQWTNREILDLDRKYGHYTFDEQLTKVYYTKNYQNKNYNKADILNEKLKTASQKRVYYKNKILEGYNKLIKIT